MNEETNEVEQTEEVETQTAAEGQVETNSVDSDKVIEKLQKRIGKEQAEKNETKTQLDQALARIEELEKGSKKSVKEKSEAEKLADEQKAKDEEITKLKTQIKLAEISQQADEVLKESGLAVGKDVLSILVDQDEEKTFANVKAVINLLNAQQQEWERKRNTGVTPKKTPTARTTELDLSKMSYSEVKKLKEEQPDVFAQLTQ